MVWLALCFPVKVIRGLIYALLDTLLLFLHFSHLHVGFGHAVLLLVMQQQCLGHTGAAQHELHQEDTRCPVFML